MEKATEKQVRKVEWLRKAILEHENRYQGEYEYKDFTVTERGFQRQDGSWYPMVAVLAEVGRKNDEGTMAAVYSRTTRIISIGPRGGMTLLNAKDGKKKVKGMFLILESTR